jgi:glutamate--cysteine ligase
LRRLFDERLRALRNTPPSVLRQGLKGLEKESLRVTPDGRIAHTPHPRALGSALTHPAITTDYSEALMELVTAPFADPSETAACLADLHAFVHRHLGTERLWASSMPCIVEGDEDVPVADYGRSNSGTMKRVYRLGLGYRYGRVMQTIAGVHYNYSAPAALWPLLDGAEDLPGRGQDRTSAHYLALVRNFRRAGWITLYLYGASPAICPSFVRGHVEGLERLDSGTLIGRHATSLRMSDLGYKNSAQAHIAIPVNSLDEYIAALTKNINTPWPPYERIGVRVGGEYRQLNANLLQIENEYYSLIRPKRRTRPCERPTQALMRAGVQYVELRSLDVDPFAPSGVHVHELRFLEALALWCLLRDSPPIDDAEQEEIDDNQQAVARYGRRPGGRLRRGGRTVALADWARELCDEVAEVAALLDGGLDDRPYSRAVASALDAVRDPHLTPSAGVLEAMRARKTSYVAFAQHQSTAHQRYFRTEYVLAPERLAELERQAQESLRAQAQLEASDTVSFDEYLRRYFEGVDTACGTEVSH